VKDTVSPKQVAQAIDVSESSVKRWCDEGKIQSFRTGGGHRRIQINGVMAFLRESGRQIIHPEIFDLPPAATGNPTADLEKERDRLIDALCRGDESVCVEIVLNLYIAGHPVSAICDNVLATAFKEIRKKYGKCMTTAYKERRSCEVCVRIFHEMRRSFPEPPPEAPIAIGGTLEGDMNALDSSMSELVLRDIGFRANSFGSDIPISAMQQAMCDSRPVILWITVSHIRDEDVFFKAFNQLSEQAEKNEVALVVSGSALKNEVRKRMRYDRLCDSFEHLETFAERLLRRSSDSFDMDS